MNTLVLPVVIMSALGGIFAFLLGIVSKLTYIPVDPKITEVRNALPGANCGACGYPGCDGCAVAIVNGEAAVSACVVGGEKVAASVAEIMGATAGSEQRYVASVKCQGDNDRAKALYEYHGVQDCRIMEASFGGCKACRYGCLGCGTCRNVCEYGAIRIVNGVAVIDQEKCTSCMKCIKICPKHIIQLVPYHAPAQVKCMNPEFGKGVKSACSIGCIGCGICVKTAPDEFAMTEKRAYVTYHPGFDMEKAELAAQKCPAKCIVFDKNGDPNVVPKENVEAVTSPQ